MRTKRENSSWAERLFGMADMEGSFRTEFLKYSELVFERQNMCRRFGEFPLQKKEIFSELFAE